MKELLHNLLLSYFPYIALAVFISGALVRLVKRNTTVRAHSTQFFGNNRLVKWGSVLFHVSMLMIVGGHIFGLLTPKWLYTLLITTETKYIIAIILGGFSGVLALVGICMLILRRVKNETLRKNSTPFDFIITSLLLLQICLGLGCTYVTANSSLENYVSLGEWAQGLALFEPNSWIHIANVHWVYKVHIIVGFAIFFIYPYTKLMHMLVAPIHYIFRPNK